MIKNYILVKNIQFKVFLAYTKYQRQTNKVKFKKGNIILCLHI